MQSARLMGQNGPYTPPMFSHTYRLTTQAESNDKGKWFGWEIERIGPIDNMSLYAAAKSFASSINSGDVTVKHTTEDAIEQGKAVPF